MKILKDSCIENTESALEEAIKSKKTQNLRDQAGASTAVSHLFSEILNRAGEPYSRISNAWGEGGEFLRASFRKAQRSIEDDPWQFLRKVAVSSFAIGLFLNTRLKKSSAGNKK